MRHFLYAVVVLLLCVAVHAEEPEFTIIENAPVGIEVTWSTLVTNNYQVDLSTDLLSDWVDSGIVEPGTGSNITYGFESNADDLCFRVREIADPYGGSFVTLPVNDQTNRLGEGVGIAFDLNVMTNDYEDLPGSLDILLREHGTGAQWEHIGHITDFMERKGIRFVRGCVIWIPGDTGVFDVRSIVKTDNDVVCALEGRKVSIITNEPPAVVIQTAQVTSYGSYLECTTAVTDSFDVVEYVDFYDDGILVGRDNSAPFGDDIKNREDDRIVLFNGTHNITAVACDSLGDRGLPSSPFLLQTSGHTDLPRPKLQITNPTSEITVMQGETFTADLSLINSTGSYVNVQIYAEELMDNAQQILSTAPFQSMDISTTGWEPGMHIVKFYARENYPYGPWGAVMSDSYPQYIDVYIETPERLAFAQMLASNIVDEASVTFTNARYMGVMPASATFTNGLAHGLQMDEGVIMTTGSAMLWNSLIENTDDADESRDNSFTNREEAGDEWLKDYIEAETSADAAVLVFQMTPSYKQSEQWLQHGSDEYMEFVGGYNDAFVVKQDRVVTSLLPDCSDLILIGTVHGDFGMVTATNEHLFLCGSNIINDVSHEKIEYDDMSIKQKLTCISSSIEPRNYSITITDINDDRVDTAIFVEKNSVKTLSP